MSQTGEGKGREAAGGERWTTIMPPPRLRQLGWSTSSPRKRSLIYLDPLSPSLSPNPNSNPDYIFCLDVTIVWDWLQLDQAKKTRGERVDDGTAQRDKPLYEVQALFSFFLSFPLMYICEFDFFVFHYILFL